MIKRIPAAANAVPATILLALGIFRAGISEATNQTPAKRRRRKPTSATVLVVFGVRASIASKCYRLTPHTADLAPHQRVQGALTLPRSGRGQKELRVGATSGPLCTFPGTSGMLPLTDQIGEGGAIGPST